MNTIFSLFLFFFLIYQTKCISYNCSDSSCLACTNDETFCFKCRSDFIRFYGKCGKKCSSIVNCRLCDKTEKKCVRCKSNCIFNGTYCDCTERYILTVVCLTFSICMIFIFIFCLMHKSIVRLFTTFSIMTGRVTPSILNRNEVTTNSYVNFDIDNKINDMELEREFNERKISLDKDIYKKKCFICKNNNINLKLGCNCLICFDCEKKCVKNNTCLNCNKTITSMQQVSCAICFGNTKDLSYFNCTCKNVVCKECFIKWKKQNNYCPFCRRHII